MSKINILDSIVYNQIAAGEVVENPASIVKELVENSIDSGAANISIAIEEGGIKSINVIDDGEGMSNIDLKKCIQPHSTSKIKNAEDLNTISTLGFRGEALASIASVSQLEIRSKYFDADVAYGLVVRGGEILENDIASLNKGTSVSVTKLFYNTPARYKFLKSAKSEENAVTSLIADIILSNTDVAFKYYIDKKLFYASAGKGMLNSIQSIYDTGITDNLIELNYNNSPFCITGFIGKPNSMAIKYNRNFQTIIINGRVIKDFTLSAIVQNAYAQRLMKRTFPVFVLDIIMPFVEIDVNVHPNKKEVRFAKNSKINTVVYNAVKDALTKFEYSNQLETSFVPQPIKSQTDSDNSANNNVAVNEEVTLKEYISESIKNEELVTDKNDNDIDEINQKLDYLSKTVPKVSQHITRLKEEVEEELQTVDTYQIIGQLFDTYIIIEYSDAMFIIDQHAAHERLIFDEYIAKLKNKPLDVQDLLVPYVFETDINGHQLIMLNKKVLAEMGFLIEGFGNNLIKVTSVPLQLIDINFDDFFADIVQYLVKIKSIEDISIVKDVIAKKACRNAIKGGRSLAQDDIKYIIEYFLKKGVPLQCPHGRPVTVKLSKAEIEKLFRRIV